MKKNIAIIALSIITLLSCVFAFAQKTIADKNANEAMNQRALADVQSRIAQINADSAVVAQARAQRAILTLIACEEELKKCK